MQSSENVTHDVFPPHGLTRNVHRDCHGRSHGVPDAEDLEDFQGEPRRNVVDHGPVLDRGDAEFPHAPSPRIRSRSAIRTGTALNACLKYTACFVRSTSGAISVTRGRGCMMMSPRFASRSTSMSTRYDPATFSYSCGSGKRSFWIRVTYRTSMSRITSSRRCAARNESPFSFTCSRISGGISRVGGLTKVRWAPSSASAYASEWTVRPYLRSPTRVTLCPSNEPFSSQIVYRSRRVCVGCWPAPSPALRTGFSVNSAARRAAPSCGWRSTIASLYASTIRIVSARVSPFWTEVPSALLKPRARPPSRAIALSNESRVRVDGSQNNVERIFPSSDRERFSPTAIGTILWAVLKTSRMSAGVKSRIERTSRPRKLDIKSLIHRFDLKQSGHTGALEGRVPRTAPRPAYGFGSLRPNWLTFEGRITIPPSASMYRFQSFVFCCTCFARSTAIVATTFRTTSSTSTPRISRNRYFIRSRSMVSRTIRGRRIRENCQWSHFREHPRPHRTMGRWRLCQPGPWDAVRDGRSPLFDGKNKKGRTRGSRSCLWVVEEGLLGWVLRREDRFDDVHGLPIAAEVLRDAGRELESDPQAAVLEEDVGVLQLGHVERDALALLGQGALRAPDEASAFERVDASVASGDRDAVHPAEVDRGFRLLERRHENLCRILVGHESRRFKRVHRQFLLVWRNRRD